MSVQRVTVDVVSGGYPKPWKKEKWLLDLKMWKESIALHAGTTEKDGNIHQRRTWWIAVSS